MCVYVLRGFGYVIVCVCARLRDIDDGFTAFSNSNPLHGHIQMLLNETHIVLSILRQIAEVSNVLGTCQPAGQCLVNHLNIGQIRNGTWVVTHNLTIQRVSVKEYRLYYNLQF